MKVFLIFIRYLNGKKNIMLRLNTIIFTTLLVTGLLRHPAEKTKIDFISANTTVIDGPYVLYRNDSVFINYIEEGMGSKSVKTEFMPGALKGNINLSVNTGEPGKTFAVKLKSKLTNQKAEYGTVKKMLVISDIEGNFPAFRKLLQGNGVIDENFNWTFEKGHLVLVGDFVDRGNMLMEVLWLIYALEEKAEAAGGQVHYILGNHEIMNMSGDVRYVPARYIEHAALMNRHYMQLFGPDAEIGRWLATKNVAERVGDFLFTHGGISSQVNYLQMTLKEINEKSRPFYTDTSYVYPDQRLDILFGDSGPFWYRGYYKGAHIAKLSQVDSTLEFYNIRHISTGHTVVSNNICTLYDGKLFNTDVHHAGGHSEALLVENGKFFRVNPSGEKFPVISLQTYN
jgi:hypothetical protein